MIKKKPSTSGTSHKPEELINTQGTRTKRVSGMRQNKSNIPKSGTVTGRTSKTSIAEEVDKSGSALGITLYQSTAYYTSRAMKEYGTEVVEQRAIPDYRDGLKPVHRMILWAMYKLGISNSGGYKKSARTVGEVLGKYHPHGDAGTYGAMVGVAGTKVQGQTTGWATRNCPVPLIEGQGNWGDFIDGPAAQRYTECRLSKFSDLFMLDPDYLAVMDYVPNYDDSEVVPVVLPAKVPVILLNGFSSIAVGIAASGPPFALKGVLALTRKALEGHKILFKDCASKLEFDHPYGGVCLTDSKDLVPIFKGKGSAQFMPEYEFNEVSRTLTFKNVCPGLTSSGTVSKWLEKMVQLKTVATVDDDTGKLGARYTVTFNRGLKEQDLQVALDACLDLAVRSESYDIGITIRDTLGRASFRRASVPQILAMWAEWRIGVEVKVLNRLIGIQQVLQARQELLLLAVDNLDTIVKALRVKSMNAVVVVDGVDTEVDAAAAHLMTSLSISLADANSILNMKVRQLRSLERSRLLERIKAHKAEIKTLTSYLSHPHDRVIEDLDKLMKVEL